LAKTDPAPPDVAPAGTSAPLWESGWAAPVLGVILAVIIWTAIGLFVREDFEHHSEAALRDITNVDRTLEAQVAGRLDAIDATLRDAQHFYAQDPAGFTLGPWTGIGRDPDRVSAVFVGPDGFARMGPDGALPTPVDLRARPGVAAQMADPAADRLWISAPTIGPVSGRAIIAFSRPLHDAAGRFGGVILISVDTDSFSRLFRALDLPNSAVALFGLDGIVRAHAPETGRFIGTEVPDTFLAPFRAGETQIVGRGGSPLDGFDRFNIMRRLPGYNLILSVSMSVDEALADPRISGVSLVAMGTLLSALITAVCIAIGHNRRTRRRTTAALEGAFANVGHGIMLIGPDRRIAVANRRVSELLDLPPGLAVPGRPIADLVAWQEKSGEFGDGPALVTYEQSQRAEPGQSGRVFERTRPNGTALQVRVDPLPGGGQVRSFTDVTEARRAAAMIVAARDRAEAAEAALAAALANVQHGVVLVSADNRVLLINDTASDLLGLPPQLARPGVNAEDILRFQLARGDLNDAPEMARRALAMLEQHAFGPGDAHPVEVYQRPTHDGRFVEVRITLLPDGRIIRTYTDVTAQHTALRAEADARHAAEAALRSRTEFLAVVTHELRTPLNGIIGLTGLLLAGNLPPQQESDLRMIEEAGTHLLAIVTDILQVAQLEHGRLTLREQRFDAREMLHSTASPMVGRAEAKGLDFTLHIDEALPATLLGDEERLRQVLLKLIDNAVKFTEAGDIDVHVTVLAQDPTGCRLAIIITDTGIGISPEAMDRLFRPFVQADASYGRRFGGLGLGLAICRMLLETMGGSITAESQPGTGSTFRIELSLPAAYQPPASA
jgi:signal transduction histidine kinase